MKLIVSPGSPLRGEAILPGDKSISHRTALLAALAEGPSRLRNFLDAGVTRPMLEALTALGVHWALESPAGQGPTLTGSPTLTVQGRGWRGLRPPPAPIDCGNSATTLRLLAGALAGAGLPAVLDGSEGLRRRPMRRIVDPLQQMGAPITATQGHAPLNLDARPVERPLAPLKYTLPVASAQVKTCLLLAALTASGPTCLREPGPSRDHTERLLASMGASIARKGPSAETGGFHEVGLTPRGTRPLAPLQLDIPGDFSSAAFILVAALIIPGSEVRLPAVGLNPTRTGLLEALKAMGADIRIANQTERHGEPVGDLTVRHSTLHGIYVSGDLVVRMIDEFPIFAIAAACAQGPTTVRQAVELRHKESDRIAALCGALRALGVKTDEADDGFTIHGGAPILGGDVDAQGDHRLAMALAVAGLAARQPVRVHGASVLAESFPRFPQTLRRLGADLRVEGSS